MEISWACGGGPCPSGPVRACGGRDGSGGLGRVCSVRGGFGDAAEGDFEAESAKLAHVVSDLTAGGRRGLAGGRARGLVTPSGGWQPLAVSLLLGVPRS